MRVLRHWKMILGLVAIFGAGCFTGVVALALFAFSHPSPETLNRWVNYRFKEYERRLKLTPEQHDKIKPIIQKTREQIRAIARNGCDQALPVLNDAHHQIEAELTPAQRVEFEKISGEMLQRLRDFAHKEAAKPPAPANPT